MKQLKVQAFFDGTKGHEKQTRAVLEALAGLTPLEVTEVVTTKRSVKIFFRYLFHLVVTRFFSPEATSVSEAPDLVIGTGSNCHLPMLLAASQYPSIKTITCMTPEKLLLAQFDLCLVPAHDRVEDRENVFRTLGPPCPVSDKKNHKDDRGLILIGGIDHKSHYWQTSELIEQINKIIAKTDMTWTISSSPRTPDDTEKSLTDLCNDNKAAEFFRSEDTPEGWIEEQYDNNSVVWVTADSISMVYESLSAGCKVGILPVKWKKQDNKFQRSLTALAERNLIACLDGWLQGQPLPEMASTLNEAERCAREILARWWPDRL